MEMHILSTYTLRIIITICSSDSAFLALVSEYEKFDTDGEEVLLQARLKVITSLVIFTCNAI